MKIELAEKIYLALNDMGANLGNASIIIIKKALDCPSGKECKNWPTYCYKCIRNDYLICDYKKT